jgi:hypothetical protein
MPSSNRSRDPDTGRSTPSKTRPKAERRQPRRKPSKSASQKIASRPSMTTLQAVPKLHARGTRTAIRPFAIGDAVSDASRRTRPVPNGAGLCAKQVIAQQPVECLCPLLRKEGARVLQLDRRLCSQDSARRKSAQCRRRCHYRSNQPDRYARLRASRSACAHWRSPRRPGPARSRCHHAPINPPQCSGGYRTTPPIPPDGVSMVFGMSKSPS